MRGGVPVRRGCARNAPEGGRVSGRRARRPETGAAVCAMSAGMIRIVKHVMIETGLERDRQLEQVEAAIRARFPEATTEVVQGLLDEDRVVEARLPLDQLAAWRAERPHLVRADAAAGTGDTREEDA